MKMVKKDFKKIASIILFIPIGFVSLFLIGEVISGDISGLGHLLQLLPLLIIFYAAHRWPRPTGMLLMAIGIILGAVYIKTGIFDLSSIFIVELLLFVPITISGILFYSASHNTS